MTIELPDDWLSFGLRRVDARRESRSRPHPEGIVPDVEQRGASRSSREEPCGRNCGEPRKGGCRQEPCGHKNCGSCKSGHSCKSEPDHPHACSGHSNNCGGPCGHSGNKGHDCNGSGHRNNCGDEPSCNDGHPCNGGSHPSCNGSHSCKGSHPCGHPSHPGCRSEKGTCSTAPSNRNISNSNMGGEEPHMNSAHMDSSCSGHSGHNNEPSCNGGGGHCKGNNKHNNCGGGEHPGGGHHANSCGPGTGCGFRGRLGCGRILTSPGRPVHLGGFLSGTNIYSHHRTSRFVRRKIIRMGNRVMARLKAGVAHRSAILFGSRPIRVRDGICVILGGPGGYIAASSSPRRHLAIVSLMGGTYRRQVCPIKHLSHGAANMLLLAGSNSLTSGLARPSFGGGGVCRM